MKGSVGKEKKTRQGGVTEPSKPARMSVCVFVVE